jgi:2-keto-3-deoxy-L-rhamnonate aldolase RhmA
MPSLDPFREKMLRGEICFGTTITFTDPAITELLAGELDCVWVDAEHNALSLESIQLHLMAVKGTPAFPLVRVAWNDPVLIKPVLDIGAPGIIVPLIRTAADAAQAVAACRYPPKGIRGFGPRRASRYGRDGGPEYCAQADAAIMVNVQIEHAEAVKNLDAILATDGLAGIVIGPNDLAGSMGHSGSPDHPEVQKSIDTVISRARAARKFVGIGASAEPEALADWARRGVQWLSVGADFVLLRQAAAQMIAATRAQLALPHNS